MSMRLIETQTLASTNAVIEFTSIPQTFTDLLVFVSARTTNTDTGNHINLVLYPNSVAFPDTASTYRFLNGTGGASETGSGTNFVLCGNIPTALNTSNTFSNTQILIANYAGNTNKSFSIDYASEINATGTSLGISAALRSNTAAITSLKLETGRIFAVGTTMSLYGITRA